MREIKEYPTNPVAATESTKATVPCRKEKKTTVFLVENLSNFCEPCGAPCFALAVFGNSVSSQYHIQCVETKKPESALSSLSLAHRKMFKVDKSAFRSVPRNLAPPNLLPSQSTNNNNHPPPLHLTPPNPTCLNITPAPPHRNLKKNGLTTRPPRT